MSEMAKPGITAPACIMLEVSVGKLPHTIDLVMKNTFCVLPVIENNSKATEINQYLDFFSSFLPHYSTVVSCLCCLFSNSMTYLNVQRLTRPQKAAFIVTHAHEIVVWNTSLHLFPGPDIKATLAIHPHFEKLRGIWETATPHAKMTARTHRLLKALGLLQWITFIYFHYTIKQQETINFSHRTTSRTHKAKVVT